MAPITNPILTGFNPDPSILRVGDDYYIATSTFEWFPGVQIHHSRDLVNWKLIGRPLDRPSQLDMRGEPPSCGVWAPCLTHADGLFWLIYTDVKYAELRTRYKDTHNYMVTAPSIEGPWSEPVYLNSSGFDPSLFHDDDGRKWLVNMLWDAREGRNHFAGIALQEYSVAERKLVGPIANIFKGTTLAVTEGPHLCKKDGYYYLMVAEGGTFYEHAESFARSRAISGPYEPHPANPVITAFPYKKGSLGKTGHASIVETQGGEWFMVHLCGRPVNKKGYCTLGRETSIQRIEWRADGWPYLASGEGGDPRRPGWKVEGPALSAHPWPVIPARDDFDSDKLGIDFQTLRIPFAEVGSLSERKGWLRLKGADSMCSLYTQALVARRQQHFSFRARCLMEFSPEDFQQSAGLVLYYDTKVHYYLAVRDHEDYGPVLGIIVADGGIMSEPLAGKEVAVGDRVWLEAEVKETELRFSYSLDGEEWERIGPVLDASKCSDDYYAVFGEMRFTGAFVGVCCQDGSGRRRPADFDWFEYQPL